jgi:hypothetical protein
MTVAVWASLEAMRRCLRGAAISTAVGLVGAFGARGALGSGVGEGEGAKKKRRVASREAARTSLKASRMVAVVEGGSERG